ncbi:unnamed protein product, partial [Mesorhabditis spiculigera]
MADILLKPIRSSLGVPFSRLALTANANGECTVYALGTPSSSNQQTILTAEIGPSASQVVVLKPLLQHEHFRNSKSAEFSLQCERQRVSAVAGISDFQIHSQAPYSLLFTTGAEIVQCAFDGAPPSGPRLTGVWGDPKGQAFVFDAQLCPIDPGLIAFVAERQIHVHRSGRPIFVSHSERHISNGVPSFVTQEEFDRFNGIWWSPACSRLLYEQVNEGDVHTLTFDCPGKEPSDPMRYPVAGSPNAHSSLRMLFINGDMVEDRGLRVELKDRFPWLEYLARAGFLSDGKTVWIQAANRAQTKLCLILIPEWEWQGHSPPFDRSELACLPTSPLILFDEFCESWLNSHNLIEPLPLEHPQHISFIYGTESLSDCHLCRLDSEIRPTGQLLATQERRLTHGPWSVCKSAGVVVDSVRGHVFFVANINGPLEMTICVTGYRDTTQRSVQRLTEQGWNYKNERTASSLALIPGVGFVCWLSHLDGPPQCSKNNFFFRFHVLHYPTDGGLPTSEVLCQLDTIGCTISRRFHAVDRPLLIDYKSRNSGRTHYALLLRPREHATDREGTRYPVVHHVYGGPGIQTVRADWAIWVQLLKFSDLGFCVLLADGRGSQNRGKDFEAPLKVALGTVEVADQIEALNEVALRTCCMDLTRVAVQGWSYGGFISLMSIAKHPEIYRACVAGGAVTDWRLYDTAYTERYLGYPLFDSVLKQCSVVGVVDKLPDEPGRVMIVHGLLDENVHFRHTEALIEAMLKAGKPYQLQIYPSERHGIRSSESAAHLDATFIHFICKAFDG